MGGGGSSSQSSSSTSTSSEDNRLVAESGGVAVGKGASYHYQYEDEFSDNVADAFRELVDLARDAGQVAVEATERAISNAERSLDAVAKNAEVLQKQEGQGEKTILTDIFPIAAIAIVGIGLIFVFGKKGN